MGEAAGAVGVVGAEAEGGCEALPVPPEGEAETPMEREGMKLAEGAAAGDCNWRRACRGRWRWSQNRSARSLCSDRLMVTSLLPLALASASTSDVLPTPGLPSMRMGLAPCCMPRSTRSRLQRAVGAPRKKAGTGDRGAQERRWAPG